MKRAHLPWAAIFKGELVEPIQRIVIMGAGAMGAAYGAMFSDAPGFSVSFAAGGKRYEKLKDTRIMVNGLTYKIPAVHPDRITDAPDLILVALKHHHLDAALEDIKALTRDKTIILSVMNGLESEKTIGGVCGWEKVVLSIAVGIDAVHENHLFTYRSPGKIIFANNPDLPGSTDHQRLKRISEALDRASIPNEISPDIARTLWWKFMINVGINQASAVLKAPYGVFQTSSRARSLMTMLMEEVITLARARKINLTPKDLEDWIKVLDTLSPTGKTSMLQDMEAGRKTEVEIFAGSVTAMGEESKIPTPANKIFLNLIQVMEEKRREIGRHDT